MNKRWAGSRGAWRLVVVMGICPLFAGCGKGLGVAPSQMLSDAVPQSYEIDRSVEAVWSAVRERVAADADAHVLGVDEGFRMMSWYEREAGWEDLSTDRVEMDEALRKSHRNKVTQPLEGIGITTLWLDATATGTRLHIRRAYYGRFTLPGFGHSRGGYEKAFVARLFGSRDGIF